METGTRHGAEPEAGWSPHTQSKLHSEHALLQQATVWLQQVLGSQMPAGKPASELFRDCSILCAKLPPAVAALQPLPLRVSREGFFSSMASVHNPAASAPVHLSHG